MNYFTVWARNPHSHWEAAGKLEWAGGGLAFRYGESWLASDWAYSLDPIHLPLTPANYYAANRQTLLPLFQHFLPQGWSARLMESRRNTSSGQSQIEPVNQIKYLPPAATGIQITSGIQAPKEIALPSWGEAENYCRMTQEQKPREWPLARFNALMSGGCWAGNRPKITLQGAPTLWLAKWQMPEDNFNVPQVEYATLELLQQAGFNVPVRHLIPANNTQWIYLVERFDQQPADPSYFVTAQVLLSSNNMAGPTCDARLDTGGYIAFARCLRKYSSQAKVDLVDLFRRMLANLMLNITDDHLYKLGLILNIKTHKWQLSPCFGLRPSTVITQYQNMGIGVEGRQRGIKNALSLTGEFGLNARQAQTILSELRSAFSDWHAIFEHCGVSGAERQLLGRVICLDDF